MDISSCSPVLRLNRNEPTPYPDSSVEIYPEATELEAMIASWHHVQPQNVLVTTGAFQALDAGCRSVIGGPVSLIDADWEGYFKLAQNAQLQIKLVNINSWQGTEFPTDGLLASMGQDTAVAMFSTLGNPIPYRLPSEFVHTLRCHAANSLIMIDEVYSDFVGDDYTDYAIQTAGVISVRSFSKSWGLPGIRVGYAIGQDRTLAQIRPFISQFSVPGPSLQVASWALRNPGYRNLKIQQQAEAREWLRKSLQARGIKVAPEGANWLLANFESEGNWIADALERRGILVQRQNHPTLRGCLRISTPNIQAMQQFIEVLESISNDAIAH